MDLYLFRQEQQTGPYTEAQARALVATGTIARDCPAWQEGMAEWLPLAQVLDLGALSPPPGLPPVPSNSRREPAAAATSPGAATPPVKQAEPVSAWRLINTYGVGILVAVGLILRLLSGCHH